MQITAKEARLFFVLADADKELESMSSMTRIFYEIICATTHRETSEVRLTILPSDVRMLKALGYKLTNKGRDGDHGDLYLISWE